MNIEKLLREQRKYCKLIAKEEGKEFGEASTINGNW